MLVIDERDFDKSLERLRIIQNELLDYTTSDDAKRIARVLDSVINDLNHNSTDLMMSVVRGSKLIKEEM